MLKQLNNELILLQNCWWEITSFIVLNCLVACAADQFACDNDVYCVNKTNVCDYFNNCGDNSDERGCTYPPGKLFEHLYIKVHSVDA